MKRVPKPKLFKITAYILLGLIVLIAILAATGLLSVRIKDVIVTCDGPVAAPVNCRPLR